ncbi:MAG: tyrosine-type recombinase/integrase [Bryobacteraceae bacterium]
MVFKRGDVWWFKFVWNGQLVRKSTKQANKRVAEKIEAAHRTRLAKGEVGLVEKDPAPTLGEFQARFGEHVRSACRKPRTASFFEEKYRRLLTYPWLENARLSDIGGDLIERLKQAELQRVKARQSKDTKKPERVTPATANRTLATLRRALHLAYKLELIDRVPKIGLLPGERTRDFVLSPADELRYLGACPQPLQDIAVLILETGLRLGETLALTWQDIELHRAGERFGVLHVRSGKSRHAERDLLLTARAVEMLEKRKAAAGPFVFATEAGGPFLVTYIDRLHARAREAAKFPKDFVIHSLRHTMLTLLGNAGVDAFTIKNIAGHSSVTISERYVHTDADAQERAFERLEGTRRREIVPNSGTVAELPKGNKSTNPLQ